MYCSHPLSFKVNRAYLAARERNRVCYPQSTPWPLPIKHDPFWTDAAKSSSLGDPEIQSGIIHILHQHGIYGAVHIVPTMQRQFDGPHKSVLTVSLSTEQGHDAPEETWLQAAKAIHQLLQSNRELDTLVEIVNPDRVNYKTIVSEAVSESDWENFKSVQDQIYQILMCHLKPAFLSMGLYTCREGSDPLRRPCVFVFVKPYCTHDWDGVTSRVKSVLPERLELQFRPAKMEAFTTELEDGRRFNGLPPYGQFEPYIHTGASISASGDRQRSGTLGIFIDLDVSKTSPTTPYGLSAGTHKCVLTCHHNIEPPQHSPLYQEARDHGFPLPSDQYANPDVVYPSHRKLDEAIAAWEEDKVAEQNELDQLPQQGLFSSWSRPRAVVAQMSRIKSYQKQVNLCHQLAARDPIGKVLFSSGVQVANSLGCQANDGLGTVCDVHDHHLKDFAVVKLSALEEPCCNKAPVMRETGPTLHEIQGTTQPHRGMRVFKYGSETGITTGIIQHEAIIMNRSDNPNSFFKAWAIVGHGNSAFSRPGDSGSGITDESKALVGQLHTGSQDAGGALITYMTSIVPIFEHIESAIPGSTVRISPCTPSPSNPSMKAVHNFLLAIYTRLA